MDPSEFAELLKGIYSPSADRRVGSVNKYREMAETQPDMLVLLLLQAMAHDPDMLVRQVSILLLRRAVIKHSESLWTKLSDDTKQQVKLGLLHALHHESADHMRKKLNDAVSDLASHIGSSGEWPELLDELFELSKSNEIMHRESSLLIFGQLLNLSRETMNPHLETVKDIIMNGMNDDTLQVRVSALQASAGFMAIARHASAKAMLQSLIPSMLEVLRAAVGYKRPDEAMNCLEIMVGWANDPLFFANHMEATLTLFFDICNHSTTPSIQQMAAEFLVTLAIKQPKYMARIPNYVSSMVDTLLKRLMEVDDMNEAEWNATDEEDRIEVSNSDLIEESLDNFCLAMGGKVIVPAILGPLVQMINSMADWRHRYAGLMATSLIAEGCRSALKADLPHIVALVLPRLKDPHARVRWAALNAVGQLAHDFAPKFQLEFNETVMPEICLMFEDAENPKVQSFTSSCIVSMCEKAPPETIVPYLDAILSRLYPLMSSNNKSVLEEGVTCIGALANVAKQHFIPYYDSFVPILKQILHHSNEPSWFNLRSKVIESLSLIGDAVGKEKFAPDAKEFMEALNQTDCGDYGRPDSIREQMLYASARICKIMGEEFSPFLPLILPHIFETATMQDDVFVDVCDDDDAATTEKDGWEYIVIGTRRIGVHNTALEEKNVAVRMLYCIVESLPNGIVPYVSQIVATLTPLLTFTYHKGIRGAAATTLPLVLHSVKMHSVQTGDFQPFNELFKYFFDNLMAAIKEEEFNNVMPVLLDSVSEMIELIPENSLLSDDCQLILDQIQTIIEDMRNEQLERQEIMEKGEVTDEIEVEWEEQDHNDAAICTDLADLYGVVVRTQKDIVMPLFQPKLDFVMGLLPLEGNTTAMRMLGLCMLDDSIEHMRDPMIPLLEHILPYMITYTQDESPSVRQAAAYGLGSCAQHGGEVFSHWVPESVDHLVGVIESEGSRDEEPFQAPTENAICAVGKIILYQPLTPERAQSLIPLWLSWLPLFTDQLEARVCHGILCTLIEQNNQYVWGENFQYLPKILDIFAWCLSGEGLLFINDEVLMRMKGILTGMRSTGPELLEQGLSSLSGEQQETLRNMMDAQI